jgi:uncharacterized protein
VNGLLASPLGALIGVLMGAFGAGGSLLAIPILVYVVGQSPREAQAAALLIVISASLAALVSHLRAGTVRWRMGLAFGLAGGLGALVGSFVSARLNPDVLLLAFAPVMLLGGAAVVSERARRPAEFRPWRFGVELNQVLLVLALGLAVGFVIGLFGVGGGFVIVPVLVLVMHMSMVEAVGTSLLVVSVASAFAFGDRLETGDLDLAVAVPFAVAALFGALAGRRLATRIEVERLQRSFAVLIAIAAVYTAARSAVALF